MFGSLQPLEYCPRAERLRVELAWSGNASRSAVDFRNGLRAGQRYHPVILAQAAATLSEMFPQRLWCAFGSGQYLNEHITGQRWPSKSERNERLRESVRVIRALWNGETLNERGKFFDVEDAKLYTRPTTPPLIYAPVLSEATARFVGSWADGLITVQAEPEKLRRIVDAFREEGGEGKPLSLQVHVAYAETDEEARNAAFEQWRTNIFASQVLSDIKTPEQFDALAQTVRPQDMDKAVRISSDLKQHLAWLQEYVAIGFDHIYLHEVGLNQERFIDTFGANVLPNLE